MELKVIAEGTIGFIEEERLSDGSLAHNVVLKSDDDAPVARMACRSLEAAIALHKEIEKVVWTQPACLCPERPVNDAARCSGEKPAPGPWILRNEGHPDLPGSLWIDAPCADKPALAFGRANGRMIAAAPKTMGALKRSVRALELQRFRVRNETPVQEAVRINATDLALAEARAAISEANG